MTYMKKATVLLVALGLTYSAKAQTPEQFSKNAAAFTASSTEIVRTAGPTSEKWVKISARLKNVKWDVKKTDSLLNPVIALVTFTLSTGISERVDSKEDAQLAQLGSFMDDVTELTYIPTKSGWQFSDGRKYSSSLNSWFEIRLPLDPLFFTPQRWAVEGFGIQK